MYSNKKSEVQESENPIRTYIMKIFSYFQKIFSYYFDLKGFEMFQNFELFHQLVVQS